MNNQEKEERRSVLYYVFQKSIDDNPMPKETEEKIKKFFYTELKKMNKKKDTSYSLSEPFSSCCFFKASKPNLIISTVALERLA